MSVVEEIAALILMVILAIFVLHLMKGDAGAWLKSKFLISNG